MFNTVRPRSRFVSILTAFALLAFVALFASLSVGCFQFTVDKSVQYRPSITADALASLEADGGPAGPASIENDGAELDAEADGSPAEVADSHATQRVTGATAMNNSPAAVTLKGVFPLYVHNASDTESDAAARLTGAAASIAAAGQGNPSATQSNPSSDTVDQSESQDDDDDA